MGGQSIGGIDFGKMAKRRRGKGKGWLPGPLGVRLVTFADIRLQNATESKLRIAVAQCLADPALDRFVAD